MVQGIRGEVKRRGVVVHGIDGLAVRIARRSSRRGVLGAVAGGLGGLVLGVRPGSGQEQQPRRRPYAFRMRLTGRATQQPTEACIAGLAPCRSVVEGDGTVHRIGAVFFTLDTRFTLDPANPPADGCFPVSGTVTLRGTQAGHGGYVRARIEGGTNCLTGGGTGAEFRGRLRITSGTGAFRRARGTSRFTGVATPDGLVVVEGLGRIIY